MTRDPLQGAKLDFSGAVATPSPAVPAPVGAIVFPSDAFEAESPEAKPDRLMHLALEYPEEVLRNPALPLIALSDPIRFREIHARARYHLAYGHVLKQLSLIRLDEVNDHLLLAVTRLQNLPPLENERKQAALVRWLKSISDKLRTYVAAGVSTALDGTKQAITFTSNEYQKVPQQLGTAWGYRATDAGRLSYEGRADGMEALLAQLGGA